MDVKRKVIAGAAAALAVGGAGAGIAATKLSDSPSVESKAVVEDAAKQLGVKPQALSDAIKKALSDRVDKAVAAGRLTKEQGAELKKRIAADEFPLFGPPAFGPHFGPPHPFFRGLHAAADYLGLSEAQLRTRLNGGKTLAQIAQAQNKSVAGLETAMQKEAKEKLDAAVKAGRLSKEEETRVLKDLQSRIDDLVNAQLRMQFRDHRGFGFRNRGFDRRFDHAGPPPFMPGADTGTGSDTAA
jgi:polyhydroxyalkanoate synthesis regulator phasin